MAYGIDKLLLNTIVWEDLIGRVVSFKFKDEQQYPWRDTKRHEGVVVLYPRGLGIMARCNWIVHALHPIEEISVIVLPLEEEIVWKLEHNYNNTYPSEFCFLPVR